MATTCLPPQSRKIVASLQAFLPQHRSKKSRRRCPCWFLQPDSVAAPRWPWMLRISPPWRGSICLRRAFTKDRLPCGASSCSSLRKPRLTESPGLSGFARHYFLHSLLPFSTLVCLLINNDVWRVVSTSNPGSGASLANVNLGTSFNINILIVY